MSEGRSMGATSGAFALRLPATADHVTVARQALGGLADALCWDDVVIDDIRLAVSEACNNVVTHAYPDGAAGEMIVRATVDAGRLVVVICDSGAGIDLTETKQSSQGLGLPVMRAIADDVRLRRADGATEVRLAFRVPEGVGADAV